MALDPLVHFWFSGGMNIINEERLSPSVVLAEVDQFPEDVFQARMAEWLLSEYPFLPWRERVSDAEDDKLEALTERMAPSYKLRLGLFVEGELRGWSYGWQDSVSTFYMGSSVVAPELRRQGYYSRLVKYVLNRTRELGFQAVSSNHHLTNNPVIIAKLKLGFTIKGIEVEAVNGTLLRLVYHHNELMKSAARFRAGAMGEVVARDLLIQALGKKLNQGPRKR